VNFIFCWGVKITPSDYSQVDTLLVAVWLPVYLFKYTNLLFHQVVKL